jgi:hypothetical protein
MYPVLAVTVKLPLTGRKKYLNNKNYGFRSVCVVVGGHYAIRESELPYCEIVGIP